MSNPLVYGGKYRLTPVVTYSKHDAEKEELKNNLYSILTDSRYTTPEKMARFTKMLHQLKLVVENEFHSVPPPIESPLEVPQMPQEKPKLDDLTPSSPTVDQQLQSVDPVDQTSSTPAFTPKTTRSGTVYGKGKSRRLRITIWKRI